MIVADFDQQQLRKLLLGEGIYLTVAPFVIHLRSTIPIVAESLSLLYRDYPLQLDAEFADFYIQLEPGKGLHRWFHPQAQFVFDGTRPFKPLPYDQAFAFFEWGVNWCIANHAHQFLIMHAAVLERNGQALILPGRPGAGKSTLAAALANNGWRLLSDELTMISLLEGSVVPVPRPVSLKNQSIEIIRQFCPQAVLGKAIEDTSKGTVAHMQAPQNALQKVNQAAQPAWLVFPTYIAESEVQVERMGKGDAFMQLADNSFNYHLQGEAGFSALVELIDSCECHQFSYSSLAQAISYFEQLVEGEA